MTEPLLEKIREFNAARVKEGELFLDGGPKPRDVPAVIYTEDVAYLLAEVDRLNQIIGDAASDEVALTATLDAEMAEVRAALAGHFESVLLRNATPAELIGRLVGELEATRGSLRVALEECNRIHVMLTQIGIPVAAPTAEFQLHDRVRVLAERFLDDGRIEPMVVEMHETCEAVATIERLRRQRNKARTRIKGMKVERDLLMSGLDNALQAQGILADRLVAASPVIEAMRARYAEDMSTAAWRAWLQASPQAAEPAPEPSTTPPAPDHTPEPATGLSGPCVWLRVSTGRSPTPCVLTAGHDGDHVDADGNPFPHPIMVHSPDDDGRYAVTMADGTTRYAVKVVDIAGHTLRLDPPGVKRLPDESDDQYARRSLAAIAEEAAELPPIDRADDDWPDSEFDGCARDCRIKNAHTLEWGRCAYAKEPPAPTPVVPVTKRAADGHMSLHYEPITWEQALNMVSIGDDPETDRTDLLATVRRLIRERDAALADHGKLSTDYVRVMTERDNARACIGQHLDFDKEIETEATSRLQRARDAIKTARFRAAQAGINSDDIFGDLDKIVAGTADDGPWLREQISQLTQIAELQTRVQQLTGRLSEPIRKAHDALDHAKVGTDGTAEFRINRLAEQKTALVEECDKWRLEAARLSDLLAAANQQINALTDERTDRDVS